MGAFSCQRRHLTHAALHDDDFYAGAKLTNGLSHVGKPTEITRRPRAVQAAVDNGHHPPRRLRQRVILLRHRGRLFPQPILLGIGITCNSCYFVVIKIVQLQLLFRTLSSKPKSDFMHTVLL